MFVISCSSPPGQTDGKIALKRYFVKGREGVGMFKGKYRMSRE
jgi:hypothetical protein